MGRSKKSDQSEENYGKHAGGNGQTMKGSDWKGNGGRKEDNTDTERIGKQKG